MSFAEMQLLIIIAFLIIATSYKPTLGATYVASGSYDKKIKIWDYSLGILVYDNITDTCSISQLLSVSDSVLASANTCGYIKLWSLLDGSNIFSIKGHTASITELLTTSDNTLLISASRDKTVVIWGIQNNQLIQNRVLTDTSGIMGMDLITDEVITTSLSLDSTSNMGNFSIWNFQTGNKYYTGLHCAGCNARSVKYVISQNILVTGNHGTLNFWRTNNYQNIKTITGPMIVIEQFALTTDPNILIYLPYSGTTTGIFQFNFLTSTTTNIGTGTLYTKFSYLSDVLYGLANSNNNNIEIWNWTNYKILKNLTGHTQPVADLALVAQYPLPVTSAVYVTNMIANSTQTIVQPQNDPSWLFLTIAITILLILAASSVYFWHVFAKK